MFCRTVWGLVIWTLGSVVFHGVASGAEDITVRNREPSGNVLSVPVTDDPKSKVSDDEPDGFLDDLFDGLDDPMAHPAADDDRADRPDVPTDKQPLDPSLEGEDIELGEQVDPLTRIGERMRAVQRRLSSDDTSNDTQDLQKRILGELSELLKRAKRNKQHTSGGENTNPQVTQRQTVKQPGQNQSQPQTSQRQSSHPTDSTERLGQTDAVRPDMDQMRALIKKIWGELPEREREQMLNSRVDEFLPQYEQLIEQYFRRLAEEED